MFTADSFLRIASAGFFSVVATSTVWAQQVIEVPAGHSEVIRADRVDVLVIGNDEIANATLATDDAIVVTARRVGSTNLIVLDEDGSEILTMGIDVVPVDRRQQLDVRLIAGREQLNWIRYRCGPEPGCVPGAMQDTPIQPERDAEAEERTAVEDDAAIGSGIELAR